MLHSAVRLLVDNYAATQSSDRTDVVDGNDLQELCRTVVYAQLSVLEIMEEMTELSGTMSACSLTRTA